MQRGGFCHECVRGVRKNEGFIYDPSGADIVVCEACVYSGYGLHKEWLADPLPDGNSSSGA